MASFEYVIKEFPTPIPDEMAKRYAKEDKERQGRIDDEYAKEKDRYEKECAAWVKGGKKGPEPTLRPKQEITGHDYISQSEYLKELNVMGSAGWEVVSILPAMVMFAPPTMSVTFKRAR